MKHGMNGISTGLVIRAKEVECLEVRGKVITASARVPIDGNEPQQISQGIERALVAAGVKTRRIAVSIPTQDVLFRFFSIPTVPKNEWDTTVQFEARKYIPFKIELLIWDYRAVPSSIPNRLDVIFAAIPRETFTRLQESLTGAGVQPTLIEPRSVSLARLIDPAKDKAPEGFVCVVEVEQELAHLAIVRNRTPYLTRDIGLGHAGEAMMQPPKTPTGAEGDPRGTGPNLEGVTTVLHQSGPAGISDQRAHRLLSELSVSIDFFLREYPTTNILRVVLFGDEQLVGSWCGWLTEQLRCTVELGGTAIQQRIQGPLPLSFASAVGLTQAATNSGTVSLDFHKRSLAKAPTMQRPVSQAGGSLEKLLPLVKSQGIFFGIAAVILGAVWFWGTLMVQTERGVFDQTVRSRRDTGWELNRMSGEEIKALKEKVTAQIAVLDRLGRRVSIASKLDALARSLPNGVWLTGLSFDDRLDSSASAQTQLLVNGSCYLGQAAEELSAIQTFEERLKRNSIFLAGFKATHLEQINVQTHPQQQYTYRTFQLNCSAIRKL